MKELDIYTIGVIRQYFLEANRCYFKEGEEDFDKVFAVLDLAVGWAIESNTKESK